MYYCLVEDAWGKDFNDPYEQDINTNESSSIISNTSDTDNSLFGNKKTTTKTDNSEYKTYLQYKEKFENNNDCTLNMTHINQCKFCQSRMKEMFTNYDSTIDDKYSLNNIYKFIINMIKDNNDFITLILIIFLILLLIKLLLT